MGTRSTTLVKSNGQPLVNIYRQFDGYPSGHGAELAAFLSSITLINGIQDQKAPAFANGPGCLAAQMVAHFKAGEIGGVYLVPADQVEEFRYVVDCGNVVSRNVTVTVFGYKEEPIFTGPVAEFVDFCNKENEE